jgi:hypothetical protein
MLDRLLVRGAALELGHFAVSVVHVPVVPFLLVGCAIALRDVKLRPVAVAMALFLVAWVPVYDLFGVSRHLAPALPLALVLSAAGLLACVARSPRAGAWMAAAVVVFAAGESVVAQVERRSALQDPRLDGMVWGHWIADHVRGRLAIVQGHELVMMHLPDARVGGTDVNAMYAPVTGLYLVRPAEFSSFEEACNWLRAQAITHVALDEASLSASWAAPFRSGTTRRVFSVEQFASEPGSRSPMRVFQTQWPDLPR